MKKIAESVTEKKGWRPKVRKQNINNLKSNIMEGIFVPIGFFLALFAILYVYWTTRTKERLALVEKGMDAGIFKGECSQFSLLKWGIFLIALAAGVLAGFGFSRVINEVVAFFTMILLFGGIGLIVAFWLTKTLLKKEK